MARAAAMHAASRKVPGCDVAGKLIIAPPPMSSDGGAAAHHRNHHHEVTVHDVSFGTNVSEAHLSQRIAVILEVLTKFDNKLLVLHSETITV